MLTSQINYRSLAIQILEEIPSILGMQPEPWPTDYKTGRVMKDSWVITLLAEFLNEKLNG